MKNNNALLGILVLITIVTVTIATFSLGCTETGVEPTNKTDVEGETTGEYVYGEAVVEEIQILVLESFPVQVHVDVKGYLPDGCTEIHEDDVTFKESENTFDVKITTIRPADAMCTQAIVPFERTVVLDVQGLEKGLYKVEVNNITEEFELQTDNFISE